MVVFAPKAANFGKFILSDECSVPWYVYVETFVPAFLKLLITQNVPFWDDLARDRANAISWGGKPRTGATGHSLRRRIQADQAWKQERFSQKGLRTLLVMTGPLEKIGYLFLLYASADQFYQDWQTLIQVVGNCAPGADLGHLALTDPASNVTVRETGQGFGFATITSNSGGYYVSPAAASVESGSFSMILALKVVREFSDLTGVALGFGVTSLGEYEDRIGERVDLKVGVPTDLVFRTELRSLPFLGAQVSWRIYGPTSAIGVKVLSGRLFIQRNGLN